MKALKMKSPPHPGFSVRVDCLEPHGLTVTEGAKVLGVSRSALSHLVNESADLSWDMAIRLRRHLAVRRRAGCGCSFSMMRLRWKNGLRRLRSKRLRLVLKKDRSRMMNTTGDDADVRGIAELGEEVLAVFPCETGCAYVGDTDPGYNVANGRKMSWIEFAIHQCRFGPCYHAV